MAGVLRTSQKRSRAVFFDLDGTLYDRDALVQALVADQYVTFAADLTGMSGDRFATSVLKMDGHGYGDKAEGYRRIVTESAHPSGRYNGAVAASCVVPHGPVRYTSGDTSASRAMRFGKNARI